VSPARRILLEWLLVTSCVLGLGVAAALDGWLWRFDLQLHDISLTRQDRSTDPDILIVAIDDASLTRLGRWPWPRSVHAALLDRLREAGAAGVALDIIFSEPATGDAQLAAAMRRYGKVVLPVQQREQDGVIIGEAWPAGDLRKAAAALGHIQMEFDPDSVARSVYLWEGWNTPGHPQLALALQSVSTGHALRQPDASTDHRATWQRRNWLRIPFAGPPGSFHQVSYIDVLSGQIPAEALHGKLILVGATALGMADSVPVPTSAFSRPMAGVEVHANVLSALRHGNGITLASPWLNALLAAGISFILMVLLSRSGARSGLLWTLGAIICVLAGSWLGLTRAGLWLAPAPAILSCVLAYPLWSWRRLETTQRYVDAELRALQQDVALAAPSGLDPLQQRLAVLKAAAALGRQTHRLVEELVEHLPVGVIALQGDGQVRVHNAAARHLLAASDAETLAGALRDMRWPGNVHRHQGLPLAPETALQVEAHTAAGTPLLITLAPLLPEADGASSVVIGLADLSEIEAAHQAREDTLRFVTHDMRAPLASMIGLIEVAPENVDLLPTIRRIAQDALALIDSLFRLSRAEAVDTAQFEIVDLVEVLQNATESCWSQAQAARVSIEVDAGERDEALVVGSTDLLGRAVANLLSNAIKYGGQDRQVELTLSAETSRWRVAVRDHGPGIPEQERDRLFERFGRLPSAVRRGLPGTGLGLLMVRTVAERHGGEASVDFPASGGCRFSLLLPMANEESILHG